MPQSAIDGSGRRQDLPFNWGIDFNVERDVSYLHREVWLATL